MKRSKYKVLSHTADLRLEIFGETLEELFKNAAEAIGNILVSGISRPVQSEARQMRHASGGLKEKIKAISANPNTLLVDFLNEILTKSHINKKVYKISNIKIQISNKEHIVEAELIGFSVGEFDEDVKAVTYHEVDIKNEKDIFRTKLVLDI